MTQMKQTPSTISLTVITSDTSPWTSSRRPLHIADLSGKTLCGKKAAGKELAKADWDVLHGNIPAGQQCKTCRAKALLLLRPNAQFWYLDPFNGNKKEFTTITEARKTAKTEHGTVTIWQLGPGDINKIVETVHGLDPLP